MKLDDCIKQLKHPSHDKRMQAVIQIGDTRDRKYLSLLLELFRNEEHPFVEASLVKALAKVGGNDVLKDIAPCLKHIDSRVRANTLEAFEDCDSPKVFDITIPAFYDRDPRVRGNAAKLIWKRFNKKAIPKIKEMIQKRDDSERLSAIYVLKEISEPVCLKLLELLSPGAPEKVKIKALEARAYIEDQIARKKNNSESLNTGNDMDKEYLEKKSKKSKHEPTRAEQLVFDDNNDSDDSLIDLLPVTTVKSSAKKDKYKSKKTPAKNKVTKTPKPFSSNLSPEPDNDLVSKIKNKNVTNKTATVKKEPLKTEQVKKIIKIEKQSFPLKTFAAICGIFILILIVCNIFLIKTMQIKSEGFSVNKNIEKPVFTQNDLQDFSIIKKDLNNFSSRIQRIEQTLMTLRSSLGKQERQSSNLLKLYKTFEVSTRANLRTLKKDLLALEKLKISSENNKKSPNTSVKKTNTAKKNSNTLAKNSDTSAQKMKTAMDKVTKPLPMKPLDTNLGGIFSSNLGDPVKLRKIKNLMVKGTRAMDYNDNQKALDIFKEVLLIEPQHLGAYYNIGVINYYSNHKKKALKSFQNCLAINKTHANSQFLAAECLFEFEKYDEALKLYESYVHKNPSDGPALTRIAVIYGMYKKFSKAEEFYRRSIAITPDNSFASLKLVNTLVGQKKWSEAEEVLEPLLQAEPENIEGLGYATRILFETARKEQAGKIAVKVLAESNNQEAAFVAAELAMAKGMKAKAVRYYEMLLQCDELLLDIRKKTADLLFDLNKPDKGLQHLDIIVASDKKNALYSVWLAQGLLKAGYAQDALYEFSRALKLNPDEKTKSIIVEKMKSIAEGETTGTVRPATSSGALRQKSSRVYGYSKNSSATTKKGVIRKRPEGLRPRQSDER